MKSFILLACCALAIADVSHVPSIRYLPPAKNEQVPANGDVPAAVASAAAGGQVTTTIEKQELHELPVQIDYIREGAPPSLAQQHTEPMRELMPPPLPASDMEMQMQTPAMHYLPPAMAEQSDQMQSNMVAANMEAPNNEYLTPMDMSAMMPAEHQSNVPMPPAIQYLPPVPAQEMPMEAAERNYQLYQDQPMQMQMLERQQPQAQANAAQLNYHQHQMEQQQEQQLQAQDQQDYEMMMPNMLPQQPIAPSDVESMTVEVEPANNLRMDGYYYRAVPEKQRLLH